MIYFRTYNIKEFGNVEINIPDYYYILSNNSTFDDWNRFDIIYEVIKKLKDFYLFQGYFVHTIVSDLQIDLSKESEIELKIGNYEYSLTIFEGTVIYESLIKNKELIVLRTDKSSVVLNKNKIDPNDLNIYNAIIRDNNRYSILIALGKGIREELNNIIVFSENNSNIYDLEFSALSEKFEMDVLSVINKYLYFLDSNVELTNEFNFIYNGNTFYRFGMEAQEKKDFVD